MWKGPGTPFPDLKAGGLFFERRHCFVFFERGHSFPVSVRTAMAGCIPPLSPKTEQPGRHPHPTPETPALPRFWCMNVQAQCPKPSPPLHATCQFAPGLLGPASTCSLCTPGWNPWLLVSTPASPAVRVSQRVRSGVGWGRSSFHGIPTEYHEHRDFAAKLETDWGLPLRSPGLVPTGGENMRISKN